MLRCWLQETTFMSSDKPDELFASDHVDPRVAASTLLHKCTVVSGHPGHRSAIMDRRVSLGPQTYFCMYHYDHDGENLKPVPAA